MPVMTVAMAFFIEGHQPTVSTVTSLAVLSLGVAVCVWDNQVMPPISADMNLVFGAHKISTTAWGLLAKNGDVAA